MRCLPALEGELQRRRVRRPSCRPHCSDLCWSNAARIGWTWMLWLERRLVVPLRRPQGPVLACPLVPLPVLLRGRHCPRLPRRQFRSSRLEVQVPRQDAAGLQQTAAFLRPRRHRRQSSLQLHTWPRVQSEWASRGRNRLEPKPQLPLPSRHQGQAGLREGVLRPPCSQVVCNKPRRRGLQVVWNKPRRSRRLVVCNKPRARPDPVFPLRRHCP